MFDSTIKENLSQVSELRTIESSGWRFAALIDLRGEKQNAPFGKAYWLLDRAINEDPRKWSSITLQMKSEQSNEGYTLICC